jgi:Uma2 family endonuclease
MLTMTTPPGPRKPRPTFDELYRQIEALPQRLTGQILVAGVLTTMSRPGTAHDHSLAHVERALDRFDKRFGGIEWWFRQEYEIRFPGDRLAVPDLAGWRADKWPDLPDDNPAEILPDLCVEVLSPSTQRDDRTLKLQLYASSGVAHTWLLDPDAHTVEVYEARDGLPTLIATARDADVVRLAPFDADFALESWWKHPAPPRPRRPRSPPRNRAAPTRSPIAAIR